MVCFFSEHVTCPPELSQDWRRRVTPFSGHMTLDDPLWKELDQFMVPELKVTLYIIG